jgi:phage shock protein E
MNFIKKLFGGSNPINYAQLVKDGATILDVRTPGEFQSGHIKGSVNVPLQNLSSQLSKINKTKPIITCCASGMRSASAKSLLKSAGYTEVHNGGGWNSLERKIKNG